MTPRSSWHCEFAWVDGRCAADVRITVEGDRIDAIGAAVPARPDDTRLAGFTLPGLANAHSHVFHRALRGRTHEQGGDFWSWRDAMYAVAARLEPDTYLAIARATYVEMALAGITSVGEFHYVHHRPDGRRYDDPNAMGAALVEAAAAVGIRLTLLDTLYLRGGFDEPLADHQRRFSDGDYTAWAVRVADLEDTPTVRVGAAIHSVRAVDQLGMAAVAGVARARQYPLHLHLSEQRAENEACVAATGMTPAALAAQAGVLGHMTTAIHGTHLTDEDIGRLGGARTTVCLCPTTERDLADGVGPATALAAAGSPLCVGTDSHAVIDVFEEARGVELDERLVSGTRGRHSPGALLRAATLDGHAALGWEAGELRAGRLADFTTVDITTPRLAGFDPSIAAAQIVFGAAAADVHHVVVGGEPIVRDRHHVRIEDAGEALRVAIEGVRP